MRLSRSQKRSPKEMGADVEWSARNYSSHYNRIDLTSLAATSGWGTSASSSSRLSELNSWNAPLTRYDQNYC